MKVRGENGGEYAPSVCGCPALATSDNAGVLFVARPEEKGEFSGLDLAVIFLTGALEVVNPFRSVRGSPRDPLHDKV